LQRRNIVILIVAGFMGLAAVWLANSYFGALEQKATNPSATPQGTVKILVAKQDLVFGDTITADAVQLVDWPASSVPQGAITEAQSQAFIAQNNAAVRSVIAGEPILQARASSRSLLSANIPADQRAVSIPVDEVTGVSGFVMPGDVVDVVLTRAVPGSNGTTEQQMATVILQNVAVLAIDARASERLEDKPTDSTNPSEVPELKTATLMVDVLGAQKLALATQVGKLTLVLRNANDRTPARLATLLPRDLGGSAVRSSQGGSRPAAIRRAAAPQRGSAPTNAAPPVYRPTMAVIRGTQETVESVMSNGY
jgi:pilus assembly protein CpaB